MSIKAAALACFETTSNVPKNFFANHAFHAQAPSGHSRLGPPSYRCRSLCVSCIAILSLSFTNILSAFGGVLFGYDTGTIGDILAMPYFKEHFSTGYEKAATPGAAPSPAFTAAQTSEIVSILSAGTFFGALTAAPSCDFFGRRIGLMLSVLVFTIGVILQTAAVAIPTFVAGRFFAGYGVGMISASIPLYQSETAPKWIRGSIVGSYQLAITIGLLLASIVGNATSGRNDSGSYRIPIAVQFAWAIILVAGLIFLPETPRMWIKRGKPERAAKSLSILRRLDVDHPAIVEELAEIQANHDYELSLGKASYLDCVKGNLGKRLATGCLLQALQQLTGVNFIFYYGPQYFQNSGIKNPYTTSLITSCINVASTFPGLWLVEKWGRRRLLLFGAIGMSVCQFIVGGVGTGAGTTDIAAQDALIAFVCIYIFFFACSWVRVLVFYFHFSTNILPGSRRLGRHRRDLPPQGPRQVPLHDHRLQLAPQLGHRLLDPLPGRPGQGQRQPAVQGLLPLGLLLLHLHRLRLGHDLRDKGPVPRAGRRAVRQGPPRVAVARLRPHRQLPGCPGRLPRRPPPVAGRDRGHCCQEEERRPRGGEGLGASVVVYSICYGMQISPEI